MRTLCGVWYYVLMKNKYIYIDESGDTGYTKKSTRYFILTGVIVEDCFVLSRIAKEIYKHKNNKGKSNMLHAHGEENKIKYKLIKRLREFNIKCIVFVLDKKTLFVKDSYIHVLEKLAIQCKQESIVNVVLARMDTRNKYNKRIVDMFKFYGLNLILSTPTREKSLQIADFYSWCVFTNIEHGFDEYFLLLPNIVIFR